MAGWEHFAHEADVGVRGRGASAGAAFEQAALALTAVITEPGSIRSEKEIDIRCSAPSLDVLLVDWLNAIIYEMTTRSMLFGDFEVTIEELALSGKAKGERVDRNRHDPIVEPKGATFTELRVEQDEDDSWVAQCVVDV